jgi:hypothetical protein
MHHDDERWTRAPGHSGNGAGPLHPEGAAWLAKSSRWTYPVDDVSVGVWVFLRAYYPDDAHIRREDLAMRITRLVRRGIDAPALHDALIAGIRVDAAHRNAQRDRAYVRRLIKLRDNAVRDLTRAADSVAALCSGVSTVDVRALRELAAEIATFPPSSDFAPRRVRRGRPWDARTTTADALKRLKVPAEDRRAMLSALGFIVTE